MSTDRELIEAAAKAVGHTITGWWETCNGVRPALKEPVKPGLGRIWTPLDDDGDAFRLAADLGLVVDFSRPLAGEPFCRYLTAQDAPIDARACARRAITRAAAHIGGLTDA